MKTPELDIATTESDWFYRRAWSREWNAPCHAHFDLKLLLLMKAAYLYC